MKRVIILVVLLMIFLRTDTKAVESMKYFGFYWPGEYVSELGGFTNVNFVSNGWKDGTVGGLVRLDQAALDQNENIGARGIVDVWRVFFEYIDGGYVLRSDWEQRWNQYWKEMYFYLPKIAAFYPMDEPEGNGINMTDFEKVVNVIDFNSRSLPTPIPIFTVLTPAGVLKLSSGELKLPEKINWLGFDEYGCWENCWLMSYEAKFKIVSDYMNARGGKVVMIGDGMMSGSVPTVDKQQEMVARAGKYYDLCSGTSNCVGMMPFLWKSLSGMTGVRDMPILRTEYVRMGMLVTGLPGPKCTSCPAGYNRSGGDANCDGKIDLMDFMIWKDEYLQSNGAANSNYRADFDCNGIVDLNDFLKWKDGYLRK